LGHDVDRPLVLRHPRQAHDALVEHVDHRVVVADGGGHEPLGVRRVRRHDDLHPRQVAKVPHRHWECCPPSEYPPPTAVVSTIGTETLPPEKYRILAMWL